MEQPPALTHAQRYLVFARAVYILRAYSPDWVTMPVFKHCWQILTGVEFDAAALGMEHLGDFMARLCFVGILLYDPSYAPLLRVRLHPDLSDDTYHVPFAVLAGLTPNVVPPSSEGRSE